MITPLRDRILIRPNKREEVTKGGIVLDATVASEPIKQGVVDEVGKGVKEVKKGDMVIYSPYHYENFDEDAYGKRIIIAEEDVWAIVTS